MSPPGRRATTNGSKQRVGEFGGRPEIQARLLLRVNDLNGAWARADELGPEVARIYWAEFSPYGRGSDFAGLSEAADRLIDHGRSAMALDALSMYAKPGTTDLDLSVVQRALDTFGGGPDDPELRSVSEYDVSRLLAVLRASGVTTRSSTVRVEVPSFCSREKAI